MRFMKNLMILVIILSFFNVGKSQTLISADYVGSVSKEQIIEDFGTVIIQFGVDMYKVLYETNDIHGTDSRATDTARKLRR